VYIYLRFIRDIKLPPLLNNVSLRFLGYYAVLIGSCLTTYCEAYRFDIQAVKQSNYSLILEDGKDRIFRKVAKQLQNKCA